MITFIAFSILSGLIISIPCSIYADRAAKRNHRVRRSTFFGK